MGLGRMLSGLFKKDEREEAQVKRAGTENLLTEGTEKENVYLTETLEVPLGKSAPSDGASDEVSKINLESDNKFGSGRGQGVSAGQEASAGSGNGTVTEEKILEVLSNVYDPEIPIDIVNLGLIYGIEIEGGNVRISMTMTAPGCPASTQIAGESKILVGEIPGVDSVEIEIVWDPPWDPSKMSEDAQQSLGMF